MEKYTPLDKNFTLSPAVTAGTNLTSESMHSPMKRRHYKAVCGQFLLTSTWSADAVVDPIVEKPW